MTKHISLLILLLITQFSFGQKFTSDKGLKHEYHINKEGRKARVGDLVSLHMIVKNAKGEEIRNSYNEGKPVLFPVRYSAFDADIYEAVSLMSENDSASFWINADSMYIRVFKKTRPKNVAAGSDLTFIIKTLKIRTQQEYKEEQTAKFEKQYKEDENIIIKRKKSQEKIIEAYTDTSGFKFSKTPEGVYYSIVEEGVQPSILPKNGDAVVFHYSGSFLNGHVFESSYNDVGHAITFTLGKGAVITGWESAFKYLPKGSKAIIIVPSDLGYGALNKEDKIPPHSILLFEVHLMGIY